MARVEREGAGRPRDPDIDRAIVEAALDEVAELGYSNASMTGIARRANVPKSTVYRRWDTKQDLVLEAMRVLRPHPPVELTGDTRGDLHEQFVSLYATWQDERRAQVLISLLAEMPRNPDLAAVWEERSVRPFRDRVRVAIRHGIETGQVAATADPDVIAEVALAMPVHMRLLSTGDLSNMADRLTSLVFDGISVRRYATVPLAGS